jgi:hypothetical protein
MRLTVLLWVCASKFHTLRSAFFKQPVAQKSEPKKFLPASPLPAGFVVFAISKTGKTTYCVVENLNHHI